MEDLIRGVVFDAFGTLVQIGEGTHLNRPGFSIHSTTTFGRLQSVATGDSRPGTAGRQRQKTAKSCLFELAEVTPKLPI